MLDLKVALELLYNLKISPKKTKKVKIDKALHRILACDIYAKYDIPRFDNSAMDGYALRLGYPSYIIKGAIFAGDKVDFEIKNNEAYKIMTGAKIPHNTQAVVQNEHTKIIDDKLILEIPPKESQCIKLKGEDYKQGEILLRKGKKINMQDIGILASQGIGEVEVAKKVKIIVFGSGNEIAPLFTKANQMQKNQASANTINENQIFDLNSYFLVAFLKQLNCSVKYGGILKDDMKIIQTSLQESLMKYDIVITSGGVSVGDKDYIHQVLSDMKMQILIDYLNIKPGKPVILSRKDERFILSLPGNPLASFINCMLCVPPLVQKYSLSNHIYFQETIATNASDFRTSPKTANIIFGLFEGGKFYAYNNAKYQGSQIAPLLKSNALAIFDDKTFVAKDTKIKILLYQFDFLDKINDILN